MQLYLRKIMLKYSSRSIRTKNLCIKLPMEKKRNATPNARYDARIAIYEISF